MEDRVRVLVADDEANICEILRLYLEKDGYTVDIAKDGNEALQLFENKKHDVVLLDIMMPGKDGWEVCREIRKTSDVPVIMISAKGEPIDRIIGLELGADDYIVKPFDTQEVILRIKAVLRRLPQKEVKEVVDKNAKQVVYDKLSINLTNYELKIDGQIVEAPPKEMELLFYLASSPNRVYTRDQLLDAVWSYDYIGDSRTVDVHVKRLREKLENISEKWNLKTVWGVGYKFETRQ